MNDFLQSIRNGNHSKDNRPRYNQQKPRRSYDNGNGNGNYNNNRNNGNDRKFRNRNESQPVSEEIYKGIKDALESIAKNQTEGLEVAKRRATAEERKATAFEFIASKFGNFSADQTNDIEAVETMIKSEIVNETPVVTPDVTPDVVPVIEETVEASGLKSYEIIKNSDKDMNKDEILAMILSMRNDGSTYNEIASHLASLELPTFSGRGKWHAQTIHRLCQNF